MKDNIRKITYTIDKEFDGKTIKEFLISNGYSEELIKHLKQTTNIYMNDTLYYKQKILLRSFYLDGIIYMEKYAWRRLVWYSLLKQ